jgi:hypothetical protein
MLKLDTLLNEINQMGVSYGEIYVTDEEYCRIIVQA